MAQTKNTEPEYKILIKGGYYEFPLPEGIERKITHGKWGTPMPSSHAYIIQTRPASRKKK